MKNKAVSCIVIRILTLLVLVLVGICGFKILSGTPHMFIGGAVIALAFVCAVIQLFLSEPRDAR